MNNDIPPAVSRLLSARYPTLSVSPTWLAKCVSSLRQRDPSLRTDSPDQLARAVRQRLLEKDLSEIVPPNCSRLTRDALRSGKVGDTARGAVLVQIESVVEIGYSASVLLEIAEARREARRSNVDPNAGLAETKATQPPGPGAGAHHMTDFQAAEDDKVSATTVFPRRMLKLELSDGASTVSAIEMQRINGLDMNTTRLGTKLLLKGVAVKDGYLLMTPQGVGVEGGVVEEKDAIKEEKLIQTLRGVLGREAETDTNASRSNNKACAAIAGASGRGDSRFSPDDDESELLALMEAEEAMASAAAATKTTPQPSITYTPLTSAPSLFDPVNNKASTTSSTPRTTRRTLIVPDRLTQSSGNQPGATTLASATQEDPISLIDSDDDDVFASLPDITSERVDEKERSGEGKMGKERGGVKPGGIDSWAGAIIIDSSPEPE